MRILLFAALPLLLTGWAGCMMGDDQDDKDEEDATTVQARDDEFDPDELGVAPNTTVTFENVGQYAHTVTIHFAPDPLTTTRHDEEIGAGNSTEFTFAEAGTYHVWCRHHGTMLTGMAMVVTVE